jgi:hypothetical protein
MTELQHLMLNLTESWSYPSNAINGFDKWLVSFIKREEWVDGDSDDLKDPSDCEDEMPMLMLIYLYEKKYLTEAQIKQLLSGNTYGNSYYGDWREQAEKRLGVKFHK